MRPGALDTLLRFNTAQAATYASCHVNTVQRALEAGVLHGGQRTKKGRWSIRRECLDAWLDGQPCKHRVTPALSAVDPIGSAAPRAS